MSNSQVMKLQLKLSTLLCLGSILSIQNCLLMMFMGVKHHFKCSIELLYFDSFALNSLAEMFYLNLTSLQLQHFNYVAVFLRQVEKMHAFSCFTMLNWACATKFLNNN